jgi:hypothetical protein
MLFFRTRQGRHLRLALLSTRARVLPSLPYTYTGAGTTETLNEERRPSIHRTAPISQGHHLMAILPSVRPLSPASEPSDFRQAGGIVFHHLMVCETSNLFPWNWEASQFHKRLQVYIRIQHP